jgi:hypothetical protein
LLVETRDESFNQYESNTSTQEALSSRQNIGSLISSKETTGPPALNLPLTGKYAGNMQNGEGNIFSPQK